MSLIAAPLGLDLIHGKSISKSLTDMGNEHHGAARSLGFRAVWAKGQVGIPGRRSVGSRILGGPRHF